MPYCIGIEMDSTYMYSLISCKQQIKQKYIVAPALYNTKHNIAPRIRQTWFNVSFWCYCMSEK